MPIFGPVLSQSLNQKEFGEIDYCVMRYAFECQNALGRLCDEVIYQNDLAARLRAAGILAEKEVKVVVQRRDFEKIYFLDLVVANAAIYELKTHLALVGEHEAQLLNYLFLCGCNHGKLINFRPAHVESKFLNTTVTADERHVFDVDTSLWQEQNERDLILRESMIGLLKDWGTWLDLLLYTEAVCHFLGGEEQTAKLVPLARDGILLGSQRLFLLTNGTAFRLTALTGDTDAYRRSLLSLLQLTPLRGIQWVNIGRRKVDFVSVMK